MVMRHRWITASVLVAGLTAAGTSTVQADRCGPLLGRVALPDCATWDWRPIINVPTGEETYQLRVRNGCSETMTVKVELNSGESDMRGDVPAYTAMWMWRVFEEDEKYLVEDVWCCKNMSRCSYDQ